MNKRPQRASSNERWLVSYADYMTLMFAFFVVLYSVSLVKEEEYSVLTDVLGNVFQSAEGTGVSGDGVLVSNQTRNSHFFGEKVLPGKGEALVDSNADIQPHDEVHTGSPLDILSAELSTLLAENVEGRQVQISNNGRWLEIRIDSTVLFASGSASLMRNSFNVLSSISMILQNHRYRFRVRGYTDNQPINNELFRSNWQLSAARATAIVEQFQVLGIAPQRMAIEAFGEYSPEADNATVEGRRQNRSVVIAVSPEEYIPVVPSDKQRKISEIVTLQSGQIPDSDTINVIPLTHGGIRITTRQSETTTSDTQSDSESDNK